MPNWCTNSIRLINSDSKESLREVIKDYCTGEGEKLILDFNKIIPMPEELKGKGWYEWSIKNWGTKWNCCDPVILEDDVMDFSTAWSPPLPVIAALAKKIGRDICLCYLEEGEGYCGEFLAHSNGKVRDTSFPLEDAPLWLLDEVGYVNEDDSL